MKSSAVLIICFALLCVASAQEKNLMLSLKADHDGDLNIDRNSAFWRAAPHVDAEVDSNGYKLEGYRTEVRSRWTANNIYFLFVCPYRNLYLKPSPDTAHETYELWNWNVAEVFIGSNFEDIQRYKEFEVSPQNEWVDLDINLHAPHHENGWLWNSGFDHATRIDETKHIWYAVMRIPFKAIDSRAPAPGLTFRVNLFRTDGPAGATKEIMWRPTFSKTFHVPQRFGLLRLVEGHPNKAAKGGAEP